MGSVVMVMRGACTFADKVINTGDGPKGVIIVNSDEFKMPFVIEDDSMRSALNVVMISRQDGNLILGD